MMLRISSSQQPQHGVAAPTSTRALVLPESPPVQRWSSAVIPAKQLDLGEPLLEVFFCPATAVVIAGAC